MRSVVALTLVALVGGCDEIWDIDHIGYVEKRDAAAAVDAAVDGFTVDACPADYFVLPNITTSKYRIIDATLAAWDQSNDCNDDAVGLTHLAIARDDVELTAIHTALSLSGHMYWWGGGVQAGTIDDADGWIWFDDVAIAPSAWAGIEPNDGDGTEDQWEQFVAFDSAQPTGIVDFRGALGQRALCECDGVGMGGQAQTAVMLNTD